MVRFEAILPSRYHSPKVAAKALDEVLKAFGVTAQRELKKYPPQQPTTYVRTGTLGRNWEAYTLLSGKSVTLQNTVPYSGWVQGDKSTQARRMAAKGWRGVDVIADLAAKAAIDRWEKLNPSERA